MAGDDLLFRHVDKPDYVDVASQASRLPAGGSAFRRCVTRCIRSLVFAGPSRAVVLVRVLFVAPLRDFRDGFGRADEAMALRGRHRLIRHHCFTLIE
ncbi:hypothetical protein AVEN_15781-1 [Araneus ventricosus]|uniref:Uncharacterized protein n=1 Tax=Araneus ventricosus TaxID=182803 RepID=A0A4Y2X9A3_ARAVE|nr:hypothetical protein AVEN_15781-1 [Araneus ventricosus]